MDQQGVGDVCGGVRWISRVSVRCVVGSDGSARCR